MVVIALMSSRSVNGSSHVTQLPKSGKYTSIRVNYFTSFGQVIHFLKCVYKVTELRPKLFSQAIQSILALGVLCTCLVDSMNVIENL